MARLIIRIAGDKPRRQREFSRCALHMARLWGTDLIETAFDGQEILAGVVKHGKVEPITHLGLLMHGWPDHILHKSGGVHVRHNAPPRWISVARFVDALWPRCSKDVRIAVAACSAASNPGETRWGKDAMGDGGDKSFCSALYQEIVSCAPGAVVVGHSTPGHTTRNPCLRAWGREYGRVKGTSLLNHHHGVRAHESRSARIAWVRHCRQQTLDGYQLAEVYLFGRP